MNKQERVIAVKGSSFAGSRDIVLWPDPKAPPLWEVLKVLREERAQREDQAYIERSEDCSACGADLSSEWSAKVHERQAAKINALITRLEEE